ncbi:hypothetical protein K456DRAFT_1412946 [Colletotrichum gloeosporioides 23]|nr:hypothetical protein K456DRAFT_1412946 [Colletotrichum gloeosporioides 23]
MVNFSPGLYRPESTSSSSSRTSPSDNPQLPHLNLHHRSSFFSWFGSCSSSPTPPSQPSFGDHTPGPSRTLPPIRQTLPCPTYTLLCLLSSRQARLLSPPFCASVFPSSPVPLTCPRPQLKVVRASRAIGPVHHHHHRTPSERERERERERATISDRPPIRVTPAQVQYIPISRGRQPSRSYSVRRITLQNQPLQGRKTASPAPEQSYSRVILGLN